MKLLMYLKSMVYEPYWRVCRTLQLPVNRYDLWRKTAGVLRLSKRARLRLEWIIFYHVTAHQNASLTCRHFGLHRSVFYYWLNRFDEQNLRTLENASTAPHRTRQMSITPDQEYKATCLRKQHMHWGKMKLAPVYRKMYGESLSTWQFQGVIKRHHLIPKPAKNARTQAKRLTAVKKKRITELKTRLPLLGYLLHFDTIELYWNGLKRYIITMIDEFTKLAFARMYATKSSQSVRDFLTRVCYLLDSRIANAHQDNGSEFQKYFKELCHTLGIQQYYSRPRTPKDNPLLERFNQTLEYEWLRDGNFTPDVNRFNARLKNFLVEYNSIRPHQSLGYLTPLEFAVQYKQLSERYPSSTRA